MLLTMLGSGLRVGIGPFGTSGESERGGHHGRPCEIGGGVCRPRDYPPWLVADKYSEPFGRGW
jgi:hypothetical protein